MHLYCVCLPHARESFAVRWLWRIVVFPCELPAEVHAGEADEGVEGLRRAGQVPAAEQGRVPAQGLGRRREGGCALAFQVFLRRWRGRENLFKIERIVTTL